MIPAPPPITGWTWPEEVGRAVLREVRAVPTEEACGLLVGVRREDGGVVVTSAVPAENVESPGRRRRRFLIDPLRLLEVEKSLRGGNEEVVGFYHSHPDGEPLPSEVDRTFMELWPNTLWVIAGITEGGELPQIRGWSLDPDPGEVNEVPVAPSESAPAARARPPDPGVPRGARRPHGAWTDIESPRGKKED